MLTGKEKIERALHERVPFSAGLQLEEMGMKKNSPGKGKIIVIVKSLEQWTRL